MYLEIKKHHHFIFDNKKAESKQYWRCLNLFEIVYIKNYSVAKNIEVLHTRNICMPSGPKTMYIESAYLYSFGWKHYLSTSRNTLRSTLPPLNYNTTFSCFERYAPPTSPFDTQAPPPYGLRTVQSSTFRVRQSLPSCLL